MRKVFNGAIPSQVIPKCRDSHVDLYCSQCGDKWELLERALWQCTGLNEPWDSLSLRAFQSDYMNLCIFDAFLFFMDLYGGKLLRFFRVLCW